MKFKVKTDKSERNAGKVVYSTDGTEKQILEESISYLKYGDHATMLPEKVTHRYAGQMGLRHSNTRRYAYDAMGNITHVYEDSALVARYTYDSLGRLIREDAVGFGTRIYTYDACGNILSRRQLGLTMEDTEKISPLAGETVYYEYEGDRMVSYNGDGCKYDDIGNPTFYRNNSEEANVTWTDGRRLASYNGCTFTYDGMGRRMTKGNTTYTYDFDGRLLRQSDGTRTLTFLYDHTGLAAVDYTNTSDSSVGGVYAYVKDIQGNIVSLIDKDGNPVVKYTYNAWGECVERDSAGAEIDNEQKIALINPFRYRGYYFDTETGLYYLKTRYYDPEVGRFLNADDVSFLDPDTVNGLNLYAYCDNDPVNNCDPNGEWKLPNWAKVVIGAVTIVGLGLATVFTGGAAGVVFGAAFYGALTGALSGAVISGVVGGITGGWQGFWDGAASGFMSGAIAGGITGALSAGANIATGAVKIVGSAQKTGTFFHRAASNIQAGKMAMQVGRYSQITLDRSLKKGGLIGRKMPDVIGKARWGKDLAVEVVSKSQTVLQMQTKLNAIQSYNFNLAVKVIKWAGWLGQRLF